MNSPMETQLGHDLRQLASGQPFTPDLEAIARQARQRHRRDALGKAGAGTGIAAVAAGVAVLLTATSAPRPAAPAVAAGSAAGTRTAASSLVFLADHITAASGRLPGNASLIIRTQTEGGIPPQVSYNLYADSGAFYGGGDKTSLMEAVARHQNLADGIDARALAAAKAAALAAVARDLTTARVGMVNASPNYFGLGLSPATRAKIWARARAAQGNIFKEKGIKFPANPPTGKTLQEDADNYVWNNSIDALAAGAGNPQVRAGVLRLLSTISGVTVANSVTGGQPTLTLTAGPAVFGGVGKQVLTINARTGMPISSWMGDLGPRVPSSLDTYQVARVTLASIEAGQF